MHITILIIYGVTIWLSAMAYALIAAPEAFSAVLAFGPLIVSGSIGVAIGLDLILCAVARKLPKRSQGTRPSDCKTLQTPGVGTVHHGRNAEPPSAEMRDDGRG